MQKFSAAPQELVFSFWRHRRLIFQMAKREVVGRYRGSIVGLAWSFFNPLLLLCVYTFVFSVVFKTRWGTSFSDDNASFAVILFAGLLVFGLFAESINRASALITQNGNYVKKVVFPLEILAFINLSSALFHTAVSLFVLLIVQVVLGHAVPLTALWFPIVLLPIIVGILGLTWFLSALGVYFRDITQIVAMVISVLPFVSAVFFPVSSLPEKYQGLLRLNPLAAVIENARKVLIFGEAPDFQLGTILMGVSLLIAWLGFAAFQKMRRGFADVL